MSGPTRAEWLSALEKAGFDERDDQEAVTTSELSAMLNIDRQSAARRLHKLERAGLAIKTRKRAPGVDGRMYSWPAWRLVEPPKKKRR